jgi:lysophospholipase L1-like esterase
MKFRHLVFLLISVVVALLLTEGILRLFFPFYFPDNYQVYRYDPATGYRLKNSLHSFRSTDFQEEIVTNQYGTVNFQRDFKGYKSLVFTLGDSFVEGIGVPADATFPFQLDMLLNIRDDRYDKDYGVVNLGVSGYGPKQEIVRLKEYAAKIGKPRYILALMCDNDAQDDRDFASGALYKKLLEGNPRYSAFVVHWWSWFKFDTEIGKRLTFLDKLKRWQRTDAHWRQSPTPLTGNSQNSAARLEPDYRELSQYARKTGAVLILSWIPIQLTQQPSREYQWLQAYCRQHDIAFADWFPLVQSIREQIPALPAYNHHSAGHYRTWVNGMIARAFAEQIRLHPVTEKPNQTAGYLK